MGCPHSHRFWSGSICGTRRDPSPYAFRSFFHTLKTQLHRERTLRVSYWCFPGTKAVETTEDIQLATGINSGCIAQSKDFNSHNSPQPHVQEFIRVTQRRCEVKIF